MSLVKDYIRFISDCFTEGWHIGHGVIGFVEGVCLLIAAILYLHSIFGRKKEQADKWEDREKRIMKVAKGVFLICFVVSTFAIAPFMKHREAEDTLKNTQTTNTTLVSSNAFLLGQVTQLKQDLSKSDQAAQNKLREHENEIINLKTDFNEEKREKDVEIQKITAERESALQRIAILESSPSNALAVYSNLYLLTNVLGFAKEYETDFALNANGSEVTNGAILTLPNDRRLHFDIKNLGEVSATGLQATVAAAPAIQEKDMGGDGWSCRSPIEAKIQGLRLYQWNWFAEHAIRGAGGIYQLNELKIAAEYKNDGPIQFYITISADRVKPKQYMFYVKLP